MPVVLFQLALLVIGLYQLYNLVQFDAKTRNGVQILYRAAVIVVCLYFFLEVS